MRVVIMLWFKRLAELNWQTLLPGGEQLENIFLKRNLVNV